MYPPQRSRGFHCLLTQDNSCSAWQEERAAKASSMLQQGKGFEGQPNNKVTQGTHTEDVRGLMYSRRRASEHAGPCSDRETRAIPQHPRDHSLVPVLEMQKLLE